MRIVIEHDTATTITSNPPGAAATGEAENAGGAPQSAGAETTSGDDGGGPPQWLLDVVGRAMSAEDAAPDAITDAADGGSAPEKKK